MGRFRIILSESDGGYLRCFIPTIYRINGRK